MSALSRLAATLLRDAGHTPGPDTLRRVTTTLEALGTYGATDGAHPDAPPAGRLTADVDAPGFEALTALVPQVGGTAKAGREEGSGASRILAFRQQQKAASTGRKKKLSTGEADEQQAQERRARRAAAKVAVHEVDKALRDARKGAERAEGALKKAAAVTKEAEQARAELHERVEKVAAAADAAKQEARRVAVEAEDAAQAVADAERAVEKAQRELEASE